MDESQGAAVTKPEEHLQMPTGDHDSAAAIPPNRSLTLSAARLAGSDACMNCGTPLQGPFCHYCGQPDKNLVRFFPVLVRELLEDFVDFDSRFVRTLKPLLFKPGKLTRDYLDGKRFRYVPPLRLYIFSSITFFFLAAILSIDFVEVGKEVNDDPAVPAVHISATEKEELQQALEGLENVRPGLAEEVTRKIEEAEAEKPVENGAEAKSAIPEDFTFNFNGEPWDRETNPLIIPLLPDRVNDWINDEIENSPQKGREIEKNPDLIRDKFLEMMPATMFVLLPVVALLFKFWYLFAGKYYVEHLIFALHNHSFIFVLMIITMLLTTFVEWREPAGEGPLTSVMIILNIVVYTWIPAYLLLALRRVYQQGWWMSVAKFSVIGMSYLVLLIMAGIFAAVLSFLLL